MMCNLNFFELNKNIDVTIINGASILQKTEIYYYILNLKAAHNLQLKIL